MLVNWVEFLDNRYHPALEVHSCQGWNTGRTLVDITGNRIEGIPIILVFTVFSRQPRHGDKNSTRCEHARLDQ